MTRLESRLFAQSFVVGVICTLVVVTAEAIGLLGSFDDWLYDKRATYAQFGAPAPSDKIAHLDIDDASIDAIGRWPWPRATLARILNEVNRTKPAALGLDILLSDPQNPDLIPKPDGQYQRIDNDQDLSDAIRSSGRVVLAPSFALEPAELNWPKLERVVAWFKTDLELAPEQISQKFGSSDRPKDEQELDDLFVHARRIAMRDRIDRELALGHTQLPELMPLLLPRTDPNIDSPLTRLLGKQLVMASADRAILRFGASGIALYPHPLQGTLDAVPLATFSDVAAGAGFVNYNIFDNATVRSIPLFVQYEGKLFPQIGLAVACVALGADPRQVRVDDQDVKIPSPKGTITIPTYTYHSQLLGQDVPLIAAIPWFGTRDWQTMYDWPLHRDGEWVGHTSITKAWDICLAQDAIIRNSKEIDSAVIALLTDTAPNAADRYSKALPDPLDMDAREKIVQFTMSQLKDYGLVEMYDAMPEKEMKPEDRLVRDTLHKCISDISHGMARNREALTQLQADRGQLAHTLGGKAVFVGYTAVGLKDDVTTSLHLHCPGVVVHGVIANAVLTGRWWRMASPWVGIFFTLALGLVTTFAQGRLPPLRAGLVALGLEVIYWIFNWGILFALERYLVVMAGPMIVIALIWAVCTLLRVILEGVERIRIGTENEIFQKEMSLARKVQFALVPDKAPEMAGINADGWTLPADMTGGDLFDLWKLPDGRLGILVADASGHGLAPAMIVSQVRTLVHMLSEYEPSPHDLLRRVNTRLSRDLETGRFVTAFLAFLSSDGQFEWASAGHGPMYWCPTGEGELLELDSSGLPLGVQEDWLADDPSPPLKMELTGRLIVFSDGIFEAHAPDPKAGLFGTDAIKDILQNACYASSSEIIHSIREAVQKFQGKKEPVDDQTIVVVRRVPPETAHIDGAAVYNVSGESPATMVVPVSSDFEISVDNPVLETPPT
jgi:CHASE2 domain-containing sensor protein